MAGSPEEVVPALVSSFRQKGKVRFCGIIPQVCLLMRQTHAAATGGNVGRHMLLASMPHVAGLESARGLCLVTCSLISATCCRFVHSAAVQNEHAFLLG